jgi:hypothetical protein
MTEACEALKVALKQEADGYMLTLRIAPKDLPETVILAEVNARFAVAFSEIGPDEQLQPKPVEVKSKRRQNSNVMRAAILCGEPLFQRFMEKKHMRAWNGAIGDGAFKAAEALRGLLGIDSRKELASNELALAEFDKLTAQYEMWKRGQ